MEKVLLYWQRIPYLLNPIFIKLGNFEIRYYGLMYVIAALVTYGLIVYRIKTENLNIKKETVADIFIWGISGVIIGGRLGYVLFYNLNYYLSHPLEVIVPIRDGKYVGISGMSYHGAIIGIIIAGLLYWKIKKVSFLELGDLLATTFPLGYTFGRLGNFINGELYGRATDLPIGMYFPRDPLHKLRYPSQLVEALLEGIVLFLILWSLRKKKFPKGYLLSFYIIGYGTARFLVEFIREPDPQIGYIARCFTMGQILSFGMIIGGFIVLYISKYLSERSKDVL